MKPCCSSASGRNQSNRLSFDLKRASYPTARLRQTSMIATAELRTMSVAG